MLPPIPAALRLVPGKQHLYIQYCIYNPVGALKGGDLAAFLLADGRSAFGFRYGFQASWRLTWIN
jgi:hypothetical protein